MHDHAASAIGGLLAKAKEGEGLPFVWGIIPDEADAVHWIKGQGLYVEAVISGGEFDGQRVKASVGGNLYGSFGGRFHSEPLKAGEHLLIALVEGAPDGAAVAFTRIPVEDSAPPDQAAFRTVTEANLKRFLFDVLPDGIGYSATVQNGSIYVRLIDASDFTIQTPDGGAIAVVEDKIQGGYQIKIKHGGGAVLLVTGTGLELRSPNGKSYVQVTDAGVVLHGAKFVKTEGVTLLAMDPTKGDTVVGQSAHYGTPGPGASSSRVFVGK